MTGLALMSIFILINFILAPTMNRLIVERNAMEEKEGIGKGVAENNDEIKKLKESNHQYAASYSRLLTSVSLSGY